MILKENYRIDKARQAHADFAAENEKLMHDLIGNGFMIETNYKFLDWILLILSKKKVDLPLKDIINVLIKFNKCSSRLGRKSIYSYEDIYDVQQSVNNYLRSKAYKDAADQGADLLYDSNTWEIRGLNSENAAMRYSFLTLPRIKQLIKLGLLFKITNKDRNQYMYILCRYGFGGKLEMVDYSAAINSDYYPSISGIPIFIQEIIHNYIRKHPKNIKILSKYEFESLLEKLIVNTYPKEIVNGNFTIQANYITENNEFKLMYTIEKYNLILYLSLHLFNSESPFTITTHDLTSNDKSKEHVLDIEYNQTDFLNYSSLNHHINRTPHPDQFVLKTIENFIISFYKSNAFMEQFMNTEENMYYYSKSSILDNPNKPIIKKFLNYVKECQDKNAIATKYDFIHKYMNQDYMRQENTTNVRSYQSTLFNNLLKSGIIDFEAKKKYGVYSFKLGKAYNAYKEGRLIRIT